MASLNRITLIGNLGADPEIRTFPNGGKVAQIRIATNESYKNQQGEWVEQAEWHRIELWESLAERTEQYLKKGDPVYIEGKLRSEKWKDSAGQERFAWKVRALNMQLLGKPDKATAYTTIPETQIAQEANDGLPF